MKFAIFGLMLTVILMLTTKRFLFLLFALCIAIIGESQTVEQPPERRDTLAVYKKIKKFAYKHKSTKFLFHAVFVDPAPQKYQKKPTTNKKKNVDPNLKYDGKIIRQIEVSVLDPFGNSVSDTLWQPEQNSLQKVGNKYHIRTRKRIIRNLLLFETLEPLDLLKISESERLIRGVGYVSDAHIYVMDADAPGRDSVDVKVYVLDKWALVVPIRVGLNNVRLTVRDKNIGGSGQRLEQFVNYKTNGDYQLATSYYVGNISNTFISSNATLIKTNDVVRSELAIERPFYSSLTKWAGGASIAKTWGKYEFTPAGDDATRRIPLSYHNVDMWVGNSIHTKLGKRTNSRLSNTVAAVRYSQINYNQRPSFDIDTNKVNSNSSLFLGSIGLSVSKFYKDQYIFRFGANEDIPEGLVLKFTYGLFYKEQNSPRNYGGFDISKGMHIDNVGYFSVSAAYGSFYNRKDNSSTINLGAFYFTDLLKSNKWYFRQFIYWKYVDGFNKTPLERITLRPDELYGFSNGSITGTSKMLLNLESVIYSPYSFIGFHFAPLVLIGFGALKNDDAHMFDGRIYQSYAVGMLFRNENLLTSSFQLSFGFYPNLPDGNNKYTKFNPVTGFSVKFRSFAFSKPSAITYD